MDAKKAAEIVMKRTKSLKPYIYYEANTGSIYIKFKDLESLGSLRIADHPARPRYGYRWNVRLDKGNPWISVDRGHMQWFYPATGLEKISQHILDYAKKIKDSDTYIKEYFGTWKS